jgi:hypothetical protein
MAIGQETLHMQPTHEHEQLPGIWQNMLDHHERFPRTRQPGGLDPYRDFAVAILPILKRLTTLGLDGWFRPGTQLADLIFSTLGAIGLKEDVDVRVTTAMDLDGELFAVLSDHSPGQLLFANAWVGAKLGHGPQSPYHGPLLRDLLVGSMTQPGSSSDPLVLEDSQLDPAGFVMPLPERRITHGQVWSPRVEVLDARDITRAVDVLLGQFADLWRLSRPGLPLPPMLVGHGTIR